MIEIVPSNKFFLNLDIKTKEGKKKCKSSLFQTSSKKGD